MKNRINFRLLSALLLCLMLGNITAYAQDLKFVEASQLTLVGRIFDNNPNPYHRVDTVKYKGFTKYENQQVRMSAGMACSFRTNSNIIRIKSDYAYAAMPSNTMGIASRGYDLYIKKDGKWLWAAAGAVNDKKNGAPVTLINNMGNEEKECLLYLPLLSEMKSVQIGVDENATLEAGEKPFRHRVAIFGSSFTHGISASRSGMAYPAQWSRMTGIQMLGLGCSGNCKLQPYFCTVLCDVEADAYVFDSFSNPSLKEIKERLFPFIERMNAAHPGKPLIFQQTIYRERRNFDQAQEKSEQSRVDLADSLMKIATKKYPDVYYIKTTNATSPTHETSVDGVHPGDYGYTLWAESLVKPLQKILKKYGIKY